jgi:hypothetical protein
VSVPPPHDEARQADALLGRLVAEDAEPREAALALAVLLNRAAARLHGLSRAQATARKDQPDWPGWAQLQNAARALVLQASTCRDLAARLAADGGRGGRGGGGTGGAEGAGHAEAEGR